MKKILLFVFSLFFLSSCGGNVYDRTIDIYEDATEQMLSAKSREEALEVNRRLNTEYRTLLRENSNEFAELKHSAQHGDKKVASQLEKVNECKRLYRDTKREKFKELGKSRK